LIFYFIEGVHGVFACSVPPQVKTYFLRQNMDKITKQSISQIYSKYFDIIDSFFGAIKHYLGEEEDSHIDLGIYIASYPLISDLILDALGDLDEEIEKFWSENAKKVFDYIRTQNTLKCVYSGDISPVVLENFVKRSGLYVDSIIIADPIYNLSIFQKQIILDDKYYLNKLVRHVFNIWKLKDLVLANSKENILFILPINLQLVNSKDRKHLLEDANKKFSEYINKITKQKLENAEDSLAFLENFQTTESVFEQLKKPKLLPSIFQKFEPFNKFLTNFGDTGKHSQFGDKTTGWNFGLYIQSQFTRVQEHKFFCDKLIAEPIYDYELPWFFFNYEVGCGGIDEAIINSLQKEKFEWITKVPISALKVLREENKLEYMRKLLRTGVTDLKAKNDSDLLKISEQIENNFKEAFKQQKNEIKSLEKKVAKIVKKEIPITTAISLIGLIPHPAVSVPISLFFAGRDIKKLLEQRSESKKKMSDKKDDFINLLMKSHDEK